MIAPHVRPHESRRPHRQHTPRGRQQTHQTARKEAGMSEQRDDLDVKIAAAEHRNGKPYLAEPEHCDGCADVERSWMQATCKHENADTITLLDVCGRREYLTQCEDCGTSMSQVTEVWG